MIINFINFQFGDFFGSSPNWFDWLNLILSLLVTSLSIYFTYRLASNEYKRDKKDKEVEEKEEIKNDVHLFNNQLILLNESCKKQIKNIEDYLKDLDSFRIEQVSNITNSFLNYIEVKNIYKSKSFITNEENRELLNALFSSLHILNDFSVSLRSEFRTYMEKHSFFEQKFYEYRKLIYGDFYKLRNKRAKNFTIENGIKKWSYSAEDKFIIQYEGIVTGKLENVQDVNGIIRQKLISEIIIPLRDMSRDYIPEDIDAIEVNDISNSVNSAWLDMLNLKDIHAKAIKSHMDTLIKVVESITKFMES